MRKVVQKGFGNFLDMGAMRKRNEMVLFSSQVSGGMLLP